MVVGEIAHERDLVVIGGGPGGYTAAIRAAQLGRSVTIVEREKLGGVCLNKGCIPSKHLTNAARKWKELQSSNEFGFEHEALHINHEKRLFHKNTLISGLVDGIKALCKSNSIEIIYGNAFFLSQYKIGVEQKDSYEIYSFKNAIVATGGRPETHSSIKTDNIRILDSWNIANLDEIPDHLVVYGSDALSLEMAMSYRSFGSFVTIILDNREDFFYDSSINRELKRLLKREKITVIKSAELLGVINNPTVFSVKYKVNEGEKILDASHLFLSGSMRPNSVDLGLEKIGLTTDCNGFVTVDAQCRTSIPHIAAVGDVTGGPFLAVKAIKQGKVAAETLSGLVNETDYTFLPQVIHSQPPIATVGLTEEMARERHHNVLTGQFSLTANGFASMIGKKEGFVKIVADADSELILGIHMIGEGAIELITSGTLALELCARIQDINFPLYPHPSLNESLLEAAELLVGQSIHHPPPRKRERMKH